MSGIKLIGPIVFSKSFGNPIFGQIFGHQRAENEARNTKMYRGQETHPIRINAARYEMNWANSFSKSSGNPIFGQIFGHQRTNKANLRDLIAATGLVILFKLDSNRWFFRLCDLEIWWMTPKNNRAPLLCYFKLFASFRSHWWIQTGVAVRKR